MAFQFPAAAVRTLVIASAIGIPALGVLAWPSPAHADFTVCNSTSTKVYVAYGYIDPVDGLVSRGWKTLNPGGDCRMMVSSSQTSDPHNYFFYAAGSGGSGVWQGTGRDNFCTTNKSFRIGRDIGEAACKHMGGEWHSFEYVESPSGNLRQTLTDGSTKFD